MLQTRRVGAHRSRAEVKGLAGQTHAASDDIRQKIRSPQIEMSEFEAAMEECATTVDKGRALIDAVGNEFRVIGNSVQSSAQRSLEFNASVSEQTQATKEISKGLAIVGTIAARTKNNVAQTIEAVGQSESLVNEQFLNLEKPAIRNYVQHRAKSDHFLWKKTLAEMLVGLNSLKEEELADPHSRVYSHGKASARHHKSDDRDKARTEFEQMEKASRDVVDLLDQLTEATRSRNAESIVRQY